MNTPTPKSTPKWPLIEGERYRFIWKSDAQRRRRETIAEFLGMAPTGEYMINLRPVAGTTALSEDWLIEVWPTDKPICVERLV